MVKLTVDLPQDLYDCLDGMAKRRQRERGGRASKAEIIRELLAQVCKGGGGGK